MRFLLAIFAALLGVATWVLGAPTTSPFPQPRSVPVKTGITIIELVEGVSIDSFLRNVAITELTMLNVIDGFSARLNDSSLAFIKSSPEVAYISDDYMVEMVEPSFESLKNESYPTLEGLLSGTSNDSRFDVVDSPELELVTFNGHWGLSRLSSTSKINGIDVSGSYPYSYNPASGMGAGVNIYVVDSGIRMTHVEFRGRVRWGATFGGYNDGDTNGHGTICASYAAGAIFGVAKQASIIAVKVMGDVLFPRINSVIGGLSWIENDFIRNSRRPSVVSISLSFNTQDDSSGSLDRAVEKLVRLGIHVVVSAGNDDIDAKNQTPARDPYVITVGASDIGDAKASFSNYGWDVDVFAPGVSLRGAGYHSDGKVRYFSGTSAAAPLVAGLVAYSITREGNVSPAQMLKRMRDRSLKGVLSSIHKPNCSFCAVIVTNMSQPSGQELRTILHTGFREVVAGESRNRRVG